MVKGYKGSKEEKTGEWAKRENELNVAMLAGRAELGTRRVVHARHAGRADVHTQETQCTELVHAGHAEHAELHKGRRITKRRARNYTHMALSYTHRARSDTQGT